MKERTVRGCHAASLLVFFGYRTVEKGGGGRVNPQFHIIGACAVGLSRSSSLLFIVQSGSTTGKSDYVRMPQSVFVPTNGEFAVS